MARKKLKILCPIAGVGKRLQPFTYAKPKAFLKLAGKTILDHSMQMLMETFEKGTEILFVVGYKKEMIMQHIEEHYSDHFSIKFVEQAPRMVVKDIPVFPGLGHAVYLARESGFIPREGNDHGLFIFLSDRLPLEGYDSIHDMYQQGDFEGVINASLVDHPENYGVIQLSDDKVITGIVEKPRVPVSNVAVSGIYVFNPGVTDLLLDYLEGEVKKPVEGPRELQFTPAIQDVITRGARLTIHLMDKDDILDIGRPASFLLGNKHFLEKSRFNQEARRLHRVVDSNVVPPCFIGEGVVIEHSIVGPHVSVGDGCEIRNAIIDNSVIGDGSSLHKVITSGSIIGDDCHLEDIIKDCITVGDRSVISTRKNGSC